MMRQQGDQSFSNLILTFIYEINQILAALPSKTNPNAVQNLIEKAEGSLRNMVLYARSGNNTSYDFDPQPKWLNENWEWVNTQFNTLNQFRIQHHLPQAAETINSNGENIAALKKQAEQEARWQAEQEAKQRAEQAAREREAKRAERRKKLQLTKKNKLFNTGCIKAAEGKHQEACRDYTAALAIDPNDGKLYHHRGIAYFYQGNYDMAIADFSTAASFRSDPLTFYFRGMSYERQGDFIKAHEDYVVASSGLASTHEYSKNRERLKNLVVGQYYNKAKTAMANCNFDTALLFFYKVIELEPEHVNTLSRIGCIYYRKNNFVDAIKWFSYALKRDPHNTTILHNRGRAYFCNNELNNALEDCNQVLRLQPTEPNINETIETIKNAFAKHYIQQANNATDDSIAIDMLTQSITWFSTPMAFKLRGDRYCKLFKLSEAEQDYQSVTIGSVCYEEAQNSLDQVQGMLRVSALIASLPPLANINSSNNNNDNNDNSLSFDLPLSPLATTFLSRKRSLSPTYLLSNSPTFWLRQRVNSLGDDIEVANSDRQSPAPSP